MAESEKVEFNNGFITALALFYGHNDPSMREQSVLGRSWDYRLSGARDHLYDIEVPENLDEELKERVHAFREKVFSIHDKYSLHPPSEEVNAVFKECVDILKMVDEKVFGLNVGVIHP